MDGKGYIYLENQAFSTVNLPHSTITQTSCNFSPLLMFEFGSIRRCLASLEKFIGEFSMLCKNLSIIYSKAENKHTYCLEVLSMPKK